MQYSPDIRHRRSIRLRDYDYSQAGLYFVTICTQNRLCLLGNIKDDEMILNDAGRMVVARWLDLAQRFTGIGLNEYTVMPNHFHGIIELLVGVPLVGTQNEDTQNMGQPQPERQPQPGQPQGIAPTVGDIVGAFKSITTNEYIHGVKQNHWPRFDKKLWQRNFYEHIVRDEESYLKISEYIKTNPAKWQDDTYYA
ncbi:hypothetical protein MNBD_GAMMA19-1102 [hydrothermal vent metagenome]|uniref:Transposase IS200-like domain-containing protein n=2 Tax=hydrothermal vent metagenome TaxID=652676 RepID=A0A3B1ALB2_9ZZZZ